MQTVKYLVLKDGTRHVLSPYTYYEFSKLEAIQKLPVQDRSQAFMRFKDVNHYVELTTFTADEIASCKVEMRDGNPYKAWCPENEEWQHDYRDHINYLAPLKKKEKKKPLPSKAGFPDDDACALQQRSSGNGNLDISYSNWFVQNETVESNKSGVGDTLDLMLEYTPVVRGTVYGTVLYAGKPVATFSESLSGIMTLVPVGYPKERPKELKVSHVTGEVKVKWNTDVAYSHVKLKVSYEYGSEARNLQKLAEGEASILPPYPYQYVQNETVVGQGNAAGNVVPLELNHAPIVPHTMTGTLYFNGFAIQTFMENKDGTFEFANVDSRSYLQWYATGLRLSHSTGIMEIIMNGPIAYNQVKLVVNYEYVYSSDEDDLRRAFKNDVQID